MIIVREVETFRGVDPHGGDDRLLQVQVEAPVRPRGAGDAGGCSRPALVFADIRSVGDSVATAPKNTTLRLTIPDMRRVHNVPVYNAPAGDKGALRSGTLHLKDTGFPWQKEANVYIAGHRLGYPRTESFLVFWDLNRLRPGDPVVLKDAQGKKYVYRVFDRFVVGPNNTSVREPVAGKNIVSLQTCTLPNYSERPIVRAELVAG
jgi:sortase A